MFFEVFSSSLAGLARDSGLAPIPGLAALTGRAVTIGVVVSDLSSTPEHTWTVEETPTFEEMPSFGLGSTSISAFVASELVEACDTCEFDDASEPNDTFVPGLLTGDMSSSSLPSPCVGNGALRMLS